jgi:hypothetical protein
LRAAKIQAQLRAALFLDHAGKFGLVAAVALAHCGADEERLFRAIFADIVAQAHAVLDVELHLLARAHEERQELGHKAKQHRRIARGETDRGRGGRGAGQQAGDLACAAIDETEERLVAAGGIAIKDRQLVGVELLFGILHRVHRDKVLARSGAGEVGSWVQLPSMQ